MHRLYPTRVYALLGAWLLSAAAASGAAELPTAPPVAPIQDVTETLHGVTIRDPYRYMENVRDSKVQDWLKGQGAYARGVLDRIAGRDALEQRITELTAASGDAIKDITRLPGDRIYYLKRAKGDRQFKLAMRVGPRGAEHILVDPEVQAQRTGVPHAVNYFRPSWDGKYVAYGLSAGGSEDASLHILDVAAGSDTGAVFERVHEPEVNWTPDSRAVAFNQLKAPTPGEPESEAYMDSRVLLHTVGDAPEQAVAVFGPTVTRNLGLARLDVGALLFAPGSPWVIARTTDTTLPEGLLFVGRVADLGKPGMAWTRISGYEDKITAIGLRGNDLFFMTHMNAPRKRVMRLDLRKPTLKLAVEAAATPADGVFEDFALTRDALVTAVRRGTSIVLRRYVNGKPQGMDVPMPAEGAARLSDEPAHAYADVMYTHTSWTQPSKIFVLRGTMSVEAELRELPELHNLPDVEVRNVEVPSHDGARVPLTLLYRKGLKLDGSNPTLLYAYGSYGMSETANFYPARMAWIEQGGVSAIANVRGSGVKGDPWYRAGQKANKPNTWKDGIACAQYLIANGYATPKTLAVMGTSAGGIFVGRSVTSAPQLFAAAVFDVGSLDTVREEESANGATNVSEFGTSKDPQEFKGLLEMSTYQHITDGTAYPGVLLVHGMNDPRVDVWNSGKTAARLQAASSSGKPILLRLDLQAGHGMGSTATQRNAMSADIYSFLLWQMGKTQLKE